MRVSYSRRLRLLTINEGGRGITLSVMPGWLRVYFFGKVLNVYVDVRSFR